MAWRGVGEGVAAARAGAIWIQIGRVKAASLSPSSEKRVEMSSGTARASSGAAEQTVVTRAVVLAARVKKMLRGQPRGQGR